MTIYSGFAMPAPPSKPCLEKQGTKSCVPHRTQRPRASSESDAENLITRRKVSTSKNYQPRVSIFRSLESTPKRFTGALCPVNLLEQKERFLHYGITPQFVMRNSDNLDKITRKDRGEIRFTYLSEAKVIIEAVKKKYGDGAVFVQEMFGNRIEEGFATEVIQQYLSEHNLQGEMNVYWTPDLSCTAKMMWHGPCQRYNKPEARKYTLIMKSSSENNFLRDVGIVCLANHEIGTHYFRMANDGLQPWFSDRARFQLKTMSCREFISSEEGLATINTVLHARSKFLWTSAILYYTACMAADMTFRELFDHLGDYMADKEQRWKHVMRVKRGLKDASKKGGYGNDQCYFEGAVAILRNIESTDFTLLYAGRVSLDEISRVKRLARMDCIKLPRFLRNVEKYKRTLRQIAIVNGLIPKPERFRNCPRKPPTGTKRLGKIHRKPIDLKPLEGPSTQSSSKIKLLNTMPFAMGTVGPARNHSRSISDSQTSLRSLSSPALLPEIKVKDSISSVSDDMTSSISDSSQLFTENVPFMFRPKSMPNN